jgi:hypothetical protein
MELLEEQLLPTGLEVKRCFPVCFLAQSQISLEGFALLGDEAFEQSSLALRA